MNETLLNYFNEIEKIHWWWEGRRQILKQSIRQISGLNILDIGCGTGETLTFLQGYLDNPKLYGVDNSPVAISFAKKRGHYHIQKVDAQKLPFPDKTFDTILLLDVIEHVKDDTGVLVEAKRVLKKKGQIIITAPALQFLWSNHDTGQGHYRRYTRRMLRILARQTGLTLAAVSYFNFLLSPAIISLRLLGKLKLFKAINKYDSKLNYDVAKIGVANNLLKFIFVNEIKLMKFVRYPLGISIFAILQKK